jgi:hypothetical protein
LGGGVDCQGWLLTTKRQAYTRYGGRAAARPKVPSTHGKGTTTTSQIQTKHEYNAHGPHDCLPDALMMIHHDDISLHHRNRSYDRSTDAERTVP